MNRRAAAVPETGKGRRGPGTEACLAGSATAAPSSRLTGPTHRRLPRRHRRRRPRASLQVGPRPTPAATNYCWPLRALWRRRIGDPPGLTLHHYLPRDESHLRETETTIPKSVGDYWPHFSERELIFSERELMFTFAICCRPSVCLSSVTRMHLLRRLKFLATFLRHWNLGHFLTSTKNFTEMVPGEPVRQGS